MFGSIHDCCNVDFNPPMSSQTPTQAPDDSPFSADNAKVPIGGTSSEPAVMAAESVNSNGAQPPAYTASGQQQITTADFQVEG